MEADLVFLPWLQRGAATALEDQDSLGPDHAGVAMADATVRVNDAHDVTMQLRLMGPGHVTGLQTAQVIRTDPTRGDRAFEPNYFPLVEFDEPSLPWLFTPVGADSDGKLRPWLCLVVVRKQLGVSLDPPRRGSLPVLRIGSPALPSAELPDLEDSWAWAHAQVTAEAETGPDPFAELLTGDPSHSLSRLVCGRILATDTDYLACVVPTFELGRLAGLGEPITAQEEKRLAPAWTIHPDPGFVELPVYYHWDFATGAGGDFQSLAMLLRARPLPEGVGLRPYDVSKSGVNSDGDDPTPLALGGALRPVDLAPPTWPDEEQHERFRRDLADIVNLPLNLGNDEPLLAPPRYGAVQARLGEVAPTRSDRWFEQLNLEPSARIAAQFGTEVVQQHQELLMASAWDQVDGLADVNRVLRHAQLHLAVATSLHVRHVARLQPDAGLRMLAPALGRITRAPEAHRPDTGLVAMLASTGLPAAAFGTTLRRIARPQGALARRPRRVEASLGGAAAEHHPSAVLTHLQPDAVLIRSRPVTPDSGPVTIETVALSMHPPRPDMEWSEADATTVTDAPVRPLFAVEPFVWPREPRDPIVSPLDVTPPIDATPAVLGGVHSPLIDADGPAAPVAPDGGPPPPPPPPPDGLHRPDRPILDDGAVADPGGVILDVPDRDSAAARRFRTVAAAHLSRFYPHEPRPGRTPGEVILVDVVFTAVLQLTQPRPAFHATIVTLIDLKGLDLGAGEVPYSVKVAPSFSQPMSAPLAELGQDLMLPGLDTIPPNTVVPLVTNTPFVEAYLVGLNAELGRELLWREYPAPQVATYFQQFWDTRVAPGRAADILPLDEWGDRALGDTGGEDERFVMLLRSELLRRYPNAIIYATTTGADEPEESYPIFTGAMPPDIRFFGFDLDADTMRARSLVIQEQPSAPRFGIEEDDDPGEVTHLAVSLQNSAAFAQRLRQFPVRITIPATVLLGEA